VRYGYRKIRVLLNREGWKVGKYLVERLYREEGLTLHQRRKRQRRVAEHRRECFHPTGPGIPMSKITKSGLSSATLDAVSRPAAVSAQICQPE
jgi:hypothetical protein